MQLFFFFFKLINLIYLFLNPCHYVRVCWKSPDSKKSRCLLSLNIYIGRHEGSSQQVNPDG